MTPNDKFKTLFIISTILLVLVIITSVFMLRNKKLATDSIITTQTSTSSIKQDKNYCEFNGKKYSVNESFLLNDVCGNSCICTQNLTFTCTSKTCVSTTTAPVTSSTKIISPTITPNETAGWKTYTNNTYGYEVKYPNYWTYNKFKPNPQPDNVTFNNEEQWWTMNVSVENTTKNLEENLQQRTIDLYKNATPGSIARVSDFQINNIDAKRIRWLTEGGGDTEYLIVKNNKLYIISFHGEESEEDKNIIKTFRLL